MKQNENKNKSYVYVIGFFGGLFVSTLAYASHFLNFIPFGPGVLLRMWPTYSAVAWMRGPVGHLIGILLISLISMLIALLYYLLFRRMNTVWTGIWFGLALWVVLFVGLYPLFPGIKGFNEMHWNVNITFICLFLIYGLFVGYSISYEYQQGDTHEYRQGDTQKQEKE